MKRTALIIYFCLFFALCSCTLPAVEKPIEISLNELGIPLIERYSNDPTSRIVWDMELFDNKLFIGSGDYDRNTGPVDVWYYDITENTWNPDGTLPDEMLGRFLVLDGVLIAPGTDPRDGWSFGNYYIREADKWKIVREIPDGIHNFDIIDFDGVWFFGLGVKAGETPIMCSLDKGNTFESVPMKRDGKLINTEMGNLIRVYDFFELKGELYAVYTYTSKGDEPSLTELYKYNKEANEFLYKENWQDKVLTGFIRNYFAPTKLIYNDTLFFTTGVLYKTSDMDTITPVVFESEALTVDLYSDETGAYALRYKGSQEEGFTISVWKNNSDVIDQFDMLFEFDYGAPALCFTKNENSFYFGIGEQKFNANSEDNALNGTVLNVKIKE